MNIPCSLCVSWFIFSGYSVCSVVINLVEALVSLGILYMVKIEQIPVGGFDSNFSYLLYDEKSGDSAIVDPCEH